MRYSVGIDLGSTTTKAVILDEEGRVRGRGITNSRSNYDVACEVALTEAQIAVRFSVVEAALARRGVAAERQAAQVEALQRAFREQQYRGELVVLKDVIGGLLESLRADTEQTRAVLGILDTMDTETRELYGPKSTRKSDFFRDIAGSRYLTLAEACSRDGGPPFEALAGLFDKAILDVENTPSAEGGFETFALDAAHHMDEPIPELEDAVNEALATPLEQISSVGTGYGRARLPFDEGHIRSEILCHGLGAHAMFPGTRTVLDIGGQDTKAIQVDGEGIVTSFQMNDRCAAGCGRYLGYIADEMNLGLHELGPLAQQSHRPARINSTCTVFAGAELRDRLSLGEKREDILAGLHRAIILRAMSLLARSGGVSDEFTFTGGVARNPAAVDALAGLVKDNYGDVTLNISPDSIYTGALGAALYAWRGAALAVA
jgi:benzoyl-CoA reductase subunit A